MKLELYSPNSDTPKGEVPVDFDYQAEQWVQETSQDQPEINKWHLSDDDGLVCVWERPAGSAELPVVTRRSSRFEGTWETGPDEVAIE